MTSYEAIFKRQSVRKFRMEYLPQDFFRNLSKFEHGIIPFDSKIKYSVEVYNAIDKDIHVKGMFLVKAPYYLVIYSEKSEWTELNAGYVCEQIVLYLTVKGIGSCYQGGAKITDVPVPEGMEAQMVIAFGPAAGRLYREPDKAKRLPVKELCVFKEDPTEETKLMMQAARLAPSSINSQPWRFMIYQNRIHVFIRKNILKVPDTPFRKIPAKITEKASALGRSDFDIGIMLSHISLAAEECWRDIEFEVTDVLAAKEFKNNEYRISVKLV